MRRCLAVGALLVMVSACSSGSGSSDSTPDTKTPPSTLYAPSVGGTLKWKSCSGDSLDPLQCARLSVPFDYNNPSKGSFSLKLVKRPANIRTQRVGSMLVNPGGPGFGGTDLPENAESYFSTTLIDTFDIIGWDPRGTGTSIPAIDCTEDYDRFFASGDITPDTDEERADIVASTEEFTQACFDNNGDLLPYVGTNNVARDMDMIRAALGEQKITYFGFSYGSELGATWATMFPSTVRAAVFDGATDPTSNYMQGGLDQAKGFETEFTKFLAQCSDNKKCPFYNNGNAEGAFDTLIKELDVRPLVVSKSRVSVNQAIAYTAVSEAMYSSTMWSELEVALRDAQKGDGSGLLSLFDSYYRRSPDGKYGNELEAFNAIMCLDDPGPKTVKEDDSYIPKFLEIAPRLGISFTGGYSCVFWPAKPDPRIEITGKGAGPIIVVGTTGDAATPLASSRKMASTLEDGRLIVVDENRHTGYGSNDCVGTAVDNYLITTKVSFAEKAC